MLRSFYRGKKETTYQKLIQAIQREEVNVLRLEKKNRSSEKTSSDSLKEEEITEFKKEIAKLKCYTCGWYDHTSRSCVWGLNEESYDGYVTSFPCEVDIPEEKSCGMRMVSDHSGTPDKHERLCLGKHKPSGRG
ncbi:hypothetical protein XELAEV_18013226mg [Xenopus laevis]|uniref:Uncharacterized protein n=1 Tax=Xenopus laevis TaxID=8355 RepID=A0A974HYY5_XENLA|nr:hypothetical protein XELAEV_18013226mg [Xenopus laevis]